MSFFCFSPSLSHSLTRDVGFKRKNPSSISFHTIHFFHHLRSKSRRCHWEVFVVVCRRFPSVHVSYFFSPALTLAFNVVYVVYSSTFITLSSSDKWIDQNEHKNKNLWQYTNDFMKWCRRGFELWTCESWPLSNFRCFFFNRSKCCSL